MNSSTLSQCPCGLVKPYLACCGRFIEGTAFASTPEELMRSRYSAFTKVNMEYLSATMKTPAADGFEHISTAQWASTNTWLGLEVTSSSEQQNKGYVEFIARFSREGRDDFIHEKSEFRKDDGKWFYIDGEGKRKRSSLITNTHYPRMSQ
jgi:SEC-C motif-containing protein